MKKLLIFLLLLCTIQGYSQMILVNGFKHASTPSSPSILAFNVNNDNASNSLTNTLTGVPAGSLLVITFASAQSSTDAANGAVSSSPSLTWTKRVQSKAASSGNTEIWTATFSAGGSITTTSTYSGAGVGVSAVLYSIGSAEASVGGNFNSAVSQPQPSVAVTTTRANSILICVTSDWNAASGSTTYRRTVTQTLKDDQRVPGLYQGWHYYEVVTTTTAYTEGLTSPTGESAGTSVLEIRGN
jgi:hypothetical protein